MENTVKIVYFNKMDKKVNIWFILFLKYVIILTV